MSRYARLSKPGTHHQVYQFSNKQQQQAVVVAEYTASHISEQLYSGPWWRNPRAVAMHSASFLTPIRSIKSRAISCHVNR